MNRRTCITFPVFSDFQVRVILAADVVRTGKRFGVDLTGCDAAWVRVIDKPMVGWLIFPEKPHEGWIAHESYHAICSMFREVGVRMDEETFAHHLAHLVCKIHKFVGTGK